MGASCSRVIPIPKNNAILPIQLQLLSNNNASVMFVKIIGIKSKYLMSFNPTPYSQGDVARLLRNGIRHCFFVSTITRAGLPYIERR